MAEILSISASQSLENLTHLQGISPLTPEIFTHHQPDLHLAIIEQNQLIARCSLWWHHTPVYPQEQLGFIGHYAAQNQEAATLLFNHAFPVLAQHHCTLAIAPIDGNTWHNYRWITNWGNRPIFFLEPHHPPEFVDQAIQFGFTPFSQYYSALVSDLNQSDPRLSRVSDRLKTLGITIRPLHLPSWEQELHQIYQVAQISFRQNFLYTPLTEDEFITQYTLIRPYINPQLVLLAEHQKKLIGFLFALPDWYQTQQNLPCHTIILKTVAILPQRNYAGLGNLLVSQCHQIAQDLGYQFVIHALMHQSNSSLNISTRYAQPIRQYTLFAKPI